MEPLSIVDTTGPRKRVLIDIREVSLFQRLICTQKYTTGTSETVLISLFQRCSPKKDMYEDTLHMYVHTHMQIHIL